MDKFLSCDWGTSSFRLRLVNVADEKVCKEIVTADGIAGTHQEWLKESALNEERLSFYQGFLLKQIKRLGVEAQANLAGVTVIVSGMASSSIGMIELPYKELPLKIDGSDIPTHIIEQSTKFPHKLIVISGARTGDDVLRGEETLLIGCDIADLKEKSLWVFPGTHSKHIQVVKDEAVSFKTYLTGEVFDLLSTRSILSNSVERNNLNEEQTNNFFRRGIVEGASGNLLNTVFHVRTNQLFNKNTRAQNYHYLSGLLIGAELKDIQDSSESVFLVSGDSLKKNYQQGIEMLGFRNSVQCINADKAFVKGQLRIYQSFRSRN
ncbi:MAG TPA: 2-dehydro-3-deoxygalactonokinase [Flavitalea sp.]|nr:2-dehydro-3-deoxygalactonokinase [Flavitalea sp.]